MKRHEHECQCPLCQHHPSTATAKEHAAINRVVATLNEKSRRRFVGLLALQWGRGSLERLSEITGLSRPTIRRGRAEIQQIEAPAEASRIRRSGAGRKRVEKNGRGS
jgi:hypothetical protein